MKIIIIFALVLLGLPSFAQLTFELKGTVNNKISNTLISGSKVELLSIDKNQMDYYQVRVKSEGKVEYIDGKQLDKIAFSPNNIKEFWQNQFIINSVYESIMKNGMQYKIRKGLEEDVLDYINYLQNNNLFFEDSYLESYLYSIVYKIYPEKLDDGRPGILNIKIIKDIEPNAAIAPNGTLFITTGLLSTINSESELIGVLSHEISHFVLDHSVININKAVQRQKRAEFWAAFATTVAAATEVYAASKNQYYNPGALTMSTAVLAYSIAESVNERLGLNFSKEQEIEADKCAVELMKYIHIDPNALATALDKIKTYCVFTGNYIALTGEGTHPAIEERINAIGKPSQFNDPIYDINISFVNTFNSILEFNNQHFSNCLNLAKRNEKANVATEDDYILMSLVTIYMNNSDTKNHEALEYINKAKNLKIHPTINLPKYEAIINLRLGNKNDAIINLEQYRKLIEEERLSVEKKYNQIDLSVISKYLDNEDEWAAKMINKVHAL